MTDVLQRLAAHKNVESFFRHNNYFANHISDINMAMWRLFSWLKGGPSADKQAESRRARMVERQAEAVKEAEADAKTKHKGPIRRIFK